MPEHRGGKPKPATLAAQALGRIAPASGAIVPPVQTSVTFERSADLSYPHGRVYGRPDNPTFEAAADLLTALEGGAATALFASGMAAATAVFQALEPGDHIVAPRVMYWALRNWISSFATHWGLTADFIDMSDGEALGRTIRPGKTRLVWAETPANPLWTVTDIAQVAEIAHKAGAVLAVDSTVATPVLTRPLSYGADIVMHSATKYLNGHSDVLIGTLTCARQDAFWQRIERVRSGGGGVPGSFEAWLLLRGMRTLYPRVRQQCESAAAIARHFDRHQAVHTVLYPGLPSHPGHEIAVRQMSNGFGGMLSLRFAGGRASAIGVAASARIFKRATSLGGVESLIEHRASIEGAGSPVPDDLLRLSVGIEAVEDLIGDLEQAIASVA